MKENGWIEKKEFWMKKGDYGTWICSKKNKKNKKKAGNVKVINHKKDLLDKNGMLILSKVKK